MAATNPPTKTKSLPLKRKLLFYAIPYLALLVILAAIEGFARASLPYVPSIQAYVGGRTHGDSPEGAQTFEGDPLLGWRLRANLDNQWWDYTTFSTNSRHLRHPLDIDAKAPGKLRIVCLGDSVTFGYRVPVTWKHNPLQFNPDDLPFPRLLEQRINARTDTQAEVIAMAVPGYSSHQGLAWLKRDIGWLQPDILVANFGWNDSDYRRTADKDTLTTGPVQVFLRWLGAQSQALIHASRWLRKLRDERSSLAPTAATHRVSRADYVANMLAIARVAETHGAQPVIIAQVYQNATAHPAQARAIGEYRTRLAQAAQHVGIPFLHIELLTEAAHAENQRLFGETIHPNNQGHRLLADELFEFLVARKMLTH